jgi:putative tricarboxylic transport membrane protein
LAVLVGFGMIGYIFRKLRLDVSPLVVALVLGPMLENNFRQSLFMSRGDLLIFLQRPISMVFLILLALVMIGPTLVRLFAKSRQPS